MNKIIKLLTIPALILMMAGCSQDTLEDINVNVNNPEDVPSKLIITDVMTKSAFSITGSDLAFYASVYSELNVGIHGQMYSAEIRAGEPTLATTYNNNWGTMYETLYNLKLIINKTSEGGGEEGNFHTLGIAQLLTAYNLAILTDLFEISWKSMILILLSCLGIYIAVILYTRIFGKRSFSKMSSFDFAMTVAVGSMIATTVLSKTVSLLEGAVGLLIVYALQLIAAYFRRYKIFRDLIDNKPTLIMDGPVMLKENMKLVRVTEGDLRSKLRESNVIKLSEVKAVIFESTGDMVVVHRNNDDVIDEWLLKDVQR